MAFSEEEFVSKNITVGYKNFSVVPESLNFLLQIHISSKCVKNIFNSKIFIGQLYF